VSTPGTASTHRSRYWTRVRVDPCPPAAFTIPLGPLDSPAGRREASSRALGAEPMRDWRTGIVGTESLRARMHSYTHSSALSLCGRG
jgi:hypothetical protein